MNDPNGRGGERAPRSWWRMLRRLMLLVVAAQILLPIAMFLGENALLFHPSARPTAAEGLRELATLDARVISVERPDGRVIEGYDARPAGAPDVPVLLYFHGNAGNAALRAAWLADVVSQTGLRVVLASYSGYGGNPGSPSESDIDADALAFHDHLTASGIPSSWIVVYGESIGGGPASRVAADRTCAGLILQSTLSSLPSMARRRFPWLPLAARIVEGHLPVARRAAAAPCPVLVVHGTDDGIIPFEEGRAIVAATEGAELLPVEGAGHNDLWRRGGSLYVNEIADRVRRWTGD